MGLPMSMKEQFINEAHQQIDVNDDDFQLKQPVGDAGVAGHEFSP
jgi:hypothetical protein